jgi:uncharacterized protein (TIGR00251 family)
LAKVASQRESELVVRVIPRASKPGIAGTRDGALLVRLNAPPVEGAANTELIQVISDALGVPKRAISIVSGQRSRLKRLRVEGVTQASLNAQFKIQNADTEGVD